MYEILEGFFETAIEYGILILETIGVIIILVSAVRELIAIFRKKPDAKIVLAEGIATALGFLLGGEALKTIIAPNWNAVGITCAILLMRAAMSVLIHWEVTNEKKEILEHAGHNNDRGC